MFIGDYEGKEKNLKKKNSVEQELGSCSFYCDKCEKEFEVNWLDIFELQEMTHGYSGYHLNDVYISCLKCGEIANSDSYKEEIHPDFI